MCQQGARISHLQFPSVQGDRPGMTVVKWSYATSYCEQKLHVSSRTAENVYSCIVGLPDRQHEPQQQDEKMRGGKKKTFTCLTRDSRWKITSKNDLTVSMAC